jgi:hypothetical protein
MNLGDLYNIPNIKVNSENGSEVYELPQGYCDFLSIFPFLITLITN